MARAQETRKHTPATTVAPATTPQTRGSGASKRGNAFLAEQLAASQASDTASDAVETRSGQDTTTGGFQLLGQSFGSLQAVHDWVVAQAATPGSTVPHEPVLRVTLTPGATVPASSTLWTHYSPGQKLVIEGNGATVSGARGGRPGPGYFLQYRPIVGAGTMDKPAAANFEMRGLTVSGFQSGGVQINPLTAAPTKDDPHTWDGGNTAAVEGAILEGNRFEDLGSLHSKAKDVSWAKQQYGIGGIELHGVRDSLIKDNVFDDLENGKVKGAINKSKPKGEQQDDGEHLLHAIYVRDQSSGNRIEGNRFSDVSGDAIRFSNGSNDNTVTGNRARNAGQGALVSEFYNPTAGERDSTGNTWSDNDPGRLYARGKQRGKTDKARTFQEKVSHGKRPELATK
jgi:parallel beta-helix repeat protein